MRKLTTEEFINKSRIIHGNKYNYSKIIYVNSLTRVEIICKEHGSFLQSPKCHLKGHGCQKCALINNHNTIRHTKEQFIKRAESIHGIGKYNYSKVDYKGAHIKVTIMCNKCGNEYKQKPNTHLSGTNCICYDPTKLNTQEEIIERFIKLNGNERYDYSKVVYNGLDKKIIIICKKCKKEFHQTSNNHLKGHGCFKCNISIGENFIANYLKEKNIEIIQQKTFKDCRNKLPLKFDFYIPSKNILIEYDGIQHFEVVEYWGGEKEFELVKLRDSIKTAYCIENGIKLIRIKFDLSDMEIMSVLASSLDII